MIIILIGPPGSGKGTIGELIRKNYQFPIVSSGEILRNERTKETDIGQQVADFLLSGELVPDQVINSLIEKRLKELQYEPTIILDGYPRNLNQAHALDKILETKVTVFYLDIPKNILIDRLLKRGRTDDTEEIIERRFEVYQKETQPLINYYTENKIIVKINEESSLKAFQKIETFL